MNEYSLFTNLKDYAVTECQKISDNDMVIVMAGFFPHSLKSSNHTQTFSAPYIQIQLDSGAQGICFVYGEKLNQTEIIQLVGKDVRQVVNDVSSHLQIALVDAMFGTLNKTHPTSKLLLLDGNYREKSLERAQIIASHVQARDGDAVGVIGCVENIVEQLKQKDCELRLADLHTSSETICGINVERDAKPILDWASHLLVTGNVIATRTLDLILKKTYERKIKTVFYAMTGANIAPIYLNYGAQTVISEYFPYYWFSKSTTSMLIHSETLYTAIS